MPRIRLKRAIGSIEEELLDDLLVDIEVVRLSSYAHDSDVEGRLAADVLRIHVSSILDQ